MSEIGLFYQMSRAVMQN